jgi:phenylpropionate dioxygenase-like ring-hydroxylating dioxygenase large terminal subunit
MGSPQDAFSYQPLSGSSRGGFETRLIYLHPGSFNDCIYCTIYHANILERQPQTEYTALSYVWGDAAQTQAIQLGYHQPLTKGTDRTWPSAPSPGADCYKSFK